MIYKIGTGAWQVGLSVLLAVLLTVIVAGTRPWSPGPRPPPSSSPRCRHQGGIYYPRFLDALVGGGIALAVMTLLLPANPIAKVVRKADRPCEVLGDASWASILLGLL